MEEHRVQAIIFPLPWQTEIWAAQENQGPALLGGLMKIGINYKSTMIYLLLSVSVLDHVDFLAAKAAQ